LPLGPLAASLVRVPPVVAHQVAARIGDVLRDLRQEQLTLQSIQVRCREALSSHGRFCV